MDTATTTTRRATPWNKGKLLGQKPPLQLKEIWAIRIRLQLDHRTRELALFNLAIDSKLRGCDLVGLRVHDVVQGRGVVPRAMVMQKKTQRPVQFEITEQTRDAVAAWIATAHLKPEQFLFSEPGVGIPASVDPAVFPDCRGLGGVHRARPGGLRHPYAAAHQSDADLPSDPKSSGRSAPAGAHQIGEHGQIPRNRGRRRPGDRRANGGVVPVAGSRPPEVDGRGPANSRQQEDARKSPESGRDQT
jgi:hypothetical protein